MVFSAAWNGDDLCVDPLFHPIQLLFVPSDQVEQLAPLHERYIIIKYKVHL